MNINIGGKIFQTKLATLLSVKDTLFYYIIAKRVMELDPAKRISACDALNHRFFNDLNKNDYSTHDL